MSQDSTSSSSTSSSDERRFLHDIANPISSLGLILDIVADTLATPEPGGGGAADVIENIGRCQKLLERTRELIAARRAVLIEKEKA